MISPRFKHQAPRRGAIAVMVGILLVVIVGMIACAFDSGWIALTRAQLHAGADSAALAGGTELLPGLGLNATATPGEVHSAATAAAVEYAGHNRNGDQNSCYCDGERDVIMGRAVFNPGAGVWVKTPNATPYNYVQVNLHRDQAGSNAGDGRLPLFFAPIFAIPETDVSAYATAVILPVNGFYIEDGSDDTAGLMPFAFKRKLWKRYLAAAEYYEAHPLMSFDPADLWSIQDPDSTSTPVDPLFGEWELPPNYDPDDPATYPVPSEDSFNQLFFDDYMVNDNHTISGPGVPDDVLEVKVYPHKGVNEADTPGGNFGTVDLGSGDNSAQDLKRQIEEGLNEDDLSYYDNNTITITQNDPLDAEADTGISGGIENSLESIIGDCRAMVLFETATDENGNNVIYSLVDIVGVTVIDVNLSGSEDNKTLLMQPCDFVDDNAIGDTDEEIGEDDTVFTPLILIE